MSLALCGLATVAANSSALDTARAPSSAARANRRPAAGSRPRRLPSVALASRRRQAAALGGGATSLAHLGRQQSELVSLGCCRIGSRLSEAPASAQGLVARRVGYQARTRWLKFGMSSRTVSIRPGAAIATIYHQQCYDADHGLVALGRAPLVCCGKGKGRFSAPECPADNFIGVATKTAIHNQGVAVFGPSQVGNVCCNALAECQNVSAASVHPVNVFAKGIACHLRYPRFDSSSMSATRGHVNRIMRTARNCLWCPA